MDWVYWLTIAGVAAGSLGLFIVWLRERADNIRRQAAHRETCPRLRQAVDDQRQITAIYRRFVRHFHADALAEHSTAFAIHPGGGEDVDRFVKRALEGVEQIEQAEKDAELIRLVNRINTK